MNDVHIMGLSYIEGCFGCLAGVLYIDIRDIRSATISTDDKHNIQVIIQPDNITIPIPSYRMRDDVEKFLTYCVKYNIQQKRVENQRLDKLEDKLEIILHRLDNK